MIVRRLHRSRLRARAVLLDAGGVLVLPHRGLVRNALAGIGIDVDPDEVGRAHYRAAREIDRDPENGRGATGYLHTLCRALGVPAEREAGAVRCLDHLADRGRSGEILWSEPAPDSRRALDALHDAGITVLVVTNSDGHAAENLRDAGICQIGRGVGAIVSDVIDSAWVGSAKPDPQIFRVALERARLAPSSVVHVGDMVSTDIAGAQTAGIVPIHLDPGRACRAQEHRHIRSLAGLWRHVSTLDSAPRSLLRPRPAKASSESPLPPELGEKLEHYRASLRMLEESLADHPLIRQLRFELEALQTFPPGIGTTPTAKPFAWTYEGKPPTLVLEGQSIGHPGQIEQPLDLTGRPPKGEPPTA